MIGFFEHEYLNYKKNHLKNLVAMAKIDGNVHEREIELLYKIGKKYKLKDPQIREIMEKQEEVEPDIPLEHHEKVSVLYDLVCMMMADMIIEKEEMDFLKRMFNLFEYKLDLIDEMLEYYVNDKDDIDQWEEFVYKTEKYSMEISNNY